MEENITHSIIIVPLTVLNCSEKLKQHFAEYARLWFLWSINMLDGSFVWPFETDMLLFSYVQTESFTVFV